MHVYLCGYVHMSANASRDQKRASHPLELELRMVLGVDSGPREEQQELLSAEHLPNPDISIFTNFSIHDWGARVYTYTFIWSPQLFAYDAFTDE